ncbi:glycosyltransferase family protein [Helicobacter trogontum]|uniref:hypothetical protein n=1 Tax=Helicobacter trogontum TaxID=50960 RepID=UPI000CF039B6|nr:hypothetical protein [Helicobacter trogontum]
MASIFGISSAIEFTNRDIFVISIDTQFFTSFDKLIDSYSKSNKSTFAKNISNKIHPLIGIYKADSLMTIKEQIKKEDYRIQNLLDRLQTNFIETDEIETKNLNYQEDYKEAIKILNSYESNQ